MAKLKAGTIISIPCEVMRGPFFDERLISFDTTDGPVTGFVKEAELQEHGHQWLVRALVLGVRDGLVQVRVRGSFFTTNGLATVESARLIAA